MVEFAWSDDSESYADRSVSSGRICYARPFKFDDPDPLGWELGVGLTISPRKKSIVSKPRDRSRIKTQGPGKPEKDGKMQCERMPSWCVLGTSVHARLPPTHLSAETRMHMGLSCVEACSERACKTDILVGNSDQAC